MKKTPQPNWICAVVISPSIGMRLKFSMSMNLKLNQTACSSYVSLKKHGMKSYEELKKNYLFCFEYHVKLLKCKTVYWCIALFITRYNNNKKKKKKNYCRNI